MAGVKPIVFKVAVTNRRQVDKAPAMTSTVPTKAVNPRAEILGKPVGSSYEANVADALDMLNWRYAYQYSVHGGRSRRGGIVLDFLVYTRPAATPIYVNGRYWHSKRAEDDRLQQANLSGYMRSPVRDSLIMWDEDCITVDLAYNWLYQRIGRN